MAGPAPRWSDERVEQVIGNLLRAGVLTAAAVVVLGAALYLFHHGQEHVKDRHAFVPEGPELSRPVLIVRSVWEGHGQALIQVGLLLLIATPIARVAFSAFAFARQHDRTYVVITLFVLGVLLYGLFSGHIGH
jgi:uncharacterized membrane protein